MSVDLNDITIIFWRQYSKWFIGATGEDWVSNSYANKKNLSYDVTGKCDIKFSQPKTKL